MSKNKFSSKLIASILSLMMVISIFPLSGNVFAATTEHPDAVTISVVNENGEAVEGASVKIVVDSVANGDAFISETKVTDETGVVEVIAANDFVAGDLSVLATVTADGYEESTLAKDIASGDDDYIVTLAKDVFSDVKIEGKTLEYSGNAKELVSLTKTDPADITYEIDGEVTTTVPKRTNAGTYSVKVVVTRGEKQKTQTVTSVINQKPLDFEISAVNTTYDGTEQPVVKLTGEFENDDTVKWTVNGEVFEEKKIPQKKAAGEYVVTLEVTRNDNYEKFSQTVSSKIELAEIDLGELKIATNKLTYNGNNQEALEITGKGEDYKLFYQFAEGEAEPADDAWIELTDSDKPMVKDAGSYTIYIKAHIDDNHNDKETEAYPINVTVEKADRIVSFSESTAEINPENVSGMYSEYPKTFKIEATENICGSGDITYSVDFPNDEAKEAFENNVSEIATINSATGEIEIKGTCSVKVIATVPELNNYKGDSEEYVIEVNTSPNLGGDWVAFDKDVVDYTIGEAFKENLAKNLNGALGVRKYHIEKETEDGIEECREAFGISIKEKVSGFNNDPVLEITNIAELAKCVEENNGEFPIKICVVKEKAFSYNKDENSYILNVKFADVPEAPYIIETKPNGEGWFNQAVEILPTEGYKISKTVNGDFGKSVEFNDDGINERYVYLQNSSGGITEKIPVVDLNGENLKIDTTIPDARNIKVTYNGDNDKKDGFTFFKDETSILIEVEDEYGDTESGLKCIEWCYTKSSDATSSIAADLTGKIDCTELVSDNNNKGYEVELNLDGQLRGNFTFIAVDKADNRSDVITDENKVVVVDNINPKMSAEFGLAGAGEYNPVEIGDSVRQHYYNNDVEFTFTVTEANFFSEDVTIEVEKDGESYEADVEWSKSDDAAKDEIHYGKFTLTDDGDYVVTMKYSDSSGNVMENNDEETELYTSEVITIDTIAPEISVSHNSNPTEQKTTIEVIEHNFRTEDLEVIVSAKNIKEDPVDLAENGLASKLADIENWVKDGDTYTFEIKEVVDGIYSLEASYTDVAKNNAAEESIDYTVDYTAPELIEFEYSVPILSAIINNITFGYYKPDVTVTLTTKDMTSGVESFIWSYEKEHTASIINHPEKIENVEIKNLPDEEPVIIQSNDDKSEFETSFTLSADEFNQYRGSFTAKSTDKFQNMSDGITDGGNVIVVDTVYPQIYVEYSEYNREINGNEYYYNKDIDVTFTVTEANFYPEDLKVSITRDGEPFWTNVPDEDGNISSAIDGIVWGERNREDKTVGTFTIPAHADHSGDGDYVISVEYADRSGNEMAPYTSDTYTIDTIKPVITVEYGNTDFTNQFKEENNRKYFDDVQTAKITIYEHNFISGEVILNFTATDVTGKKDILNTIEYSECNTDENDSDIHYIYVTYKGDANYTFDIEYTDKAENKAGEYTVDYFTVDKNKPRNLKVDYSTHIFETILEFITFDFYNAKMTVTISAEDATSKIHNFNYSYINSKGVSSVNDDLINQAINSEKIKYSDDNKKATATFEIPKDALTDDNQFNGTVEFTATDRAGNTSATLKDKTRIVVDDIAPLGTVTYSEPVNIEGDVSYYSGDIDVSIDITEANFYPEDVVVEVTKDGAGYGANVNWTDASVDEHIGTFTLTQDGDYFITISYEDKSTNKMTTYTSEQLTIDTDILTPVISINGVNSVGESGAYKKDVVVSYSFEDINYDSSSVRLFRTNFDSVEEVTYDFIKTDITAEGGSGRFDIPGEVLNDGIYNLTIEMADKANHKSQVSATFVVNRFGSVFVYDSYLISLIKDGGQFITAKNGNKNAVTEDLVITEYNACAIDADDVDIFITRDGEGFDADYKRQPVANDGGWYQYTYSIDAKNFEKDGFYKISLGSEYDTSDAKNETSLSVPENSFNKKGDAIVDTMNFTVDTTAPEIKDIINLENAVADGDLIIDGNLNVKYEVMDVYGLKSIEIFLNGKSIDKVTSFKKDIYKYSGDFNIPESSSLEEQSVRIVVTDLAGNVTDTSADDFNSNELFVFNDLVTVSSNVFDRIFANIRNFFRAWYNNTPLFWGSIIGIVVIAGAAGFAIAFKKKKKEDKSEDEE